MLETEPTSELGPRRTLTRVSSPGLESVVLQWLLAALAVAEAETVTSLQHLNAQAVRALAWSDAAWLREHLSDDFVCTLTNGRRLDRAGFLQQPPRPRAVDDLVCDEVDVRPLGRLGIVHGVVHSRRKGSATSTRFTHVWLVRDGRWQLVAAHLSRIVA
jgi:hypothetical protein